MVLLKISHTQVARSREKPCGKNEGLFSQDWHGDWSALNLNLSLSQSRVRRPRRPPLAISPKQVNARGGISFFSLEKGKKALNTQEGWFSCVSLSSHSLRRRTPASPRLPCVPPRVVFVPGIVPHLCRVPCPRVHFNRHGSRENGGCEDRR